MFIVTFVLLSVGQILRAEPIHWKATRVSEGDPILKRRSLPVHDQYFSSAELRQLTEALAREMFSHFRILGIAAPQMSSGLRIFLLRSSFINPFNRSYEIFVNPVVSPIGDDTESGIEFCLSTSGLRRIERFKAVRLEYYKIDGTRQVAELTGSRARIAQHELDHLNGKLISDE